MSNTTKVVYNSDYGGFSLSSEAVRLAKSLAFPGSNWHKVDEEYGYTDHEGISRHDPTLVEVLERLGDKASGMCASLKIKEIVSPLYRIDEYDGKESVEVPADVDWVSVRD